jgi:hypothetical protein
VRYGALMTGLAFLAIFCLLVGAITAAAYLFLRRTRPNSNRTALAVGIGLLTAIALVILGLAILWSGSSSEPLEAAVHIWALAVVASVVGLLTAATMAALKV